jgi:hypothetical protein
MKTNELFRHAMRTIGDKAANYNPTNNAEITEYLTTLSNRTQSTRRKANYLALAEAIINRDLESVNAICTVMTRPSAIVFEKNPLR